ncbi:FtsB family cell division protein [Thermodesulfatator indicus]
MPKGQKKKSSQKFNSFWDFLSLKALILSFLFLFVVGSLSYFYLDRQIAHLSSQKENLLLTKAHLSAKISRLKSDPQAYEEIARKRYGLVKDGERLIIFK